MSDSIYLRQFLVILIAAVAVVSVFRRLRARAVLGYLARPLTLERRSR